jgi:biopolymer transport protein ExbD
MSGISMAGSGSSRIARRGSRMRRGFRRQKFTLQLTSLMDVLMIIVVFLLKSYGISSMGVVQTSNLQLPVSRAPETYGEGMALVIAKDRIMLDNEPLLQFDGDPALAKFVLPPNSIDSSSGERGILPLYDALLKKKQDYETLASRSEDPKAALQKWTGEILVQADKEVPYELVRRVMYTSGMAGYKTFRLTVEKQSE